MKKVNFAIIGCGRISYRHIEAIRENPNANLIALCDLNLELAKERGKGLAVKFYRDYNKMLQQEKIDVVSIMTPSGMHAEHAIDIINKYGKHIIIEKPMCLRVSDGIKLIDIAKKKKVRLFVVHQNRFNKAVQKIKRTLDSGLLGKPVLGTVRIRWARGQSYYARDPWRGTWAFDGGALTNQAIHHIDLLRWLMGEVESLSAVSATQLVDIEVEDTACVWLKFKSGALGVIEATTASRPENIDLEASVSLLGKNGVVIAEGASVNRLATWTLGDIDLADFSENPPNVYGYGHNVIINNVVDVLRGKVKKPLVSAEDALNTIRLLNAIYCSIESDGKQISLKDNKVSRKLGVIDKNSLRIANSYRNQAIFKDK